MTRRACLCGAVDCARHRRRSHPSKPGAYGSDHQERRRRMLAGIAAGTIPAICAYCHEGPKPGPEWAWEADHVVPVARNGGPEVRPAHARCNKRHGAQLLKQMRKEAADRRAAERIAETARLLRGRTG